MIKVAITGNIASGKSCTEEYIRQAGYIVIDSDKINHDILAHDIKTIQLIKQAFKDFDITKKDGSISREKLGQIVFRNKEKKKLLENILYKEISKKIELFFESYKTESIIFVSAAMLFESGFYKDYDKIIFVSAPKEVRLRRLIERNNYSYEYALERINAQEDEDRKLEKSDYIINNTADLVSLKKQTLEILKELSSLS